MLEVQKLPSLDKEGIPQPRLRWGWFEGLTTVNVGALHNHPRGAARSRPLLI